MSEQKNMRCPFRVDKDGEFALCYGSECMAYYEYDQFSASASGPIRMAMCKRVPFVSPYRGEGSIW